jgi:Zn-dependent protease with chaperone function
VSNPTEGIPPRSIPSTTPISAYTLEPATRQKAEDHAHAEHLIYAVDLVWGLLALLLVLQLRIAPRIAQFAERVARRRIFQAFVFAPLFLFTLGVLQLPISIWGHSLQRRFGLSIQGWGSFARDWAIGQGISLFLGALFVWILYAVMRRAPRRWWLWAWAAMMPVFLFIVFLSPFLIEPLFFKFSPLKDRDPKLTAQLQAIAKKGGEEIPESKMFVMDASEKLRAVNAYVTGFGASKRVVVWDTTLGAMDAREIEFVFGHELGHYVLGHVVLEIGTGAVSILIALWLASLTVGGLIRRYGPRWGIGKIDEWASLPILLIVFSVLSALSSPASAAFSRRLEHQADAFGLDVIEGVVDDPPQAAAHAFQRLGEIDLEPPDPGPLTVFWLYDHPAIRDRIAFVVRSMAGAVRTEQSATAPTPPPR